MVLARVDATRAEASHGAFGSFDGKLFRGLRQRIRERLSDEGSQGDPALGGDAPGAFDEVLGERDLCANHDHLTEPT